MLVAGVDSSTQSVKVVLCRAEDGPDATGIVSGPTTANAIPQNLARAAIEGVLASLADAAGLLADFGVRFSRVLLIGGGARSAAMRALAPGMFGHEVDVPEPCEYVALGAARQAAWALAGPPEPPAWPRPPAERYHGDQHPAVLASYASLRDASQD